MTPENAILLRESQIQLADMRKVSTDRDFYEVDRALLGEIYRLKNELDATKKAKAENDERFMTERDAARAENERLRTKLAEEREIIDQQSATIEEARIQKEHWSMEYQKLREEFDAIRERKVVKVEWRKVGDNEDLGTNGIYNTQAYRVSNGKWNWAAVRPVKRITGKADTLAEAKAAAEQALAELQSELHSIDIILANRNIFNDCKTRSEKILKCIAAGKKLSELSDMNATMQSHSDALLEENKNLGEQIADLEAQLADAAKQLDEPCDCCPTYEAAFDELEKLLDVKSVFGEDGRAWQAHHVVEAVKVLKAKQKFDLHDAEEYRRIDKTWEEVKLHSLIHPSEKG
jgi:regulator of replication initiation timing